jgi:TonB family protein
LHNPAATIQSRELQIRRLAAAVSASLGLHALVAAALDELPYASSPVASAARSPLRVTLREERRAATEVADADDARRAANGKRQLPGARADRGLSSAQSALPVPYYYTSGELDARPGIMTDVQPAYPQRAAARNLSGKVVIRIFINESGGVDKVIAVRADPPGYFEDAATDAFRAARFTPGVKNGVAVRSQIAIEVSFDGPSPQGLQQHP